MNCFPALFIICGVLLNTTSTEGKNINSYAGPYTARGTRLYECDQDIVDRLLWRFSLRFSHVNPVKPQELQRVSGTTTGTVPINDTWWLHLFLDTWSNNQWKENAFRFVFPNAGCTNMFRNAPGTKILYGKLLKQLKPCVIVPGTNSYNDTPVDFLFPNVPIMPYMRFRGRWTMNVGGLTHPAICTVFEGAFDPKI